MDFIDIVAWRHTGEFAANYFAKGSMAVVEGRLQIRDWTDREGGRRRTAEVVASSIYFGDSAKKKSAPPPPRTPMRPRPHRSLKVKRTKSSRSKGEVPAL